jgi:hypothetical protein
VSERPGDRLGLILVSLGVVICVLLIVLVALLATRDDGPGATVAGSTPASSSTIGPATSSSGPAAAIPPAGSTPLVTSTTGPPSTAVTTTTVVVLPSFVTEDCVTYDPGTVGIEGLGADGWQLTGGLGGVLLFDTESDARMGLAVAGNHTMLCFLGRGNTQPDPSRYVHEFWYGASGARVPVPGPEDCLSYDPAALSVESPGGGVWQVMEGDRPMVSYATEADALAGLALAEAFRERCFIGRDNERPERRLYIVEYWK